MSAVVVDVDPELYVAASEVLGRDMCGELRRVWSQLTAALQGCAAMAGSDPGGTAWAAGYDPAAATTAGAITDLANACAQVATLLGQTGFNHGIAESDSVPGRVVSAPPDRRRYEVIVTGMVCVDGHDIPRATGGSVSAPAGWSLLEHAVGELWPDGSQGALRTASSAWTRAGADLDVAAGCVDEALRAIGEQTSPEVDDAARVCRSLASQIGDVADECRSLAAACSALAEHIDKAHSAIENEVAQFVAWTVTIEAAGAALSVFTFGGSEAVAQGVEAERAVVVGGRIAAFIRTFTAAARVVSEMVNGVVDRIAGIVGRLRPILGARISEATTLLVPRLAGAAGDAERLSYDRLIMESRASERPVISSASRGGSDSTRPGIGKITKHGAERIAGPNATRGGTLTESEILATRANGAIMTQRGGGSVHLWERRPGKFHVVIDGDHGFVTSIRSASAARIARLARNHGWTK